MEPKIVGYLLTPIGNENADIEDEQSRVNQKPKERPPGVKELRKEKLDRKRHSKTLDMMRGMQAKMKWTNNITDRGFERQGKRTETERLYMAFKFFKNTPMDIGS